jgi:hypothetical protein
MTVDPLRHFREVWAVDFEFTAPPGHRPTPLCLVARELRTGRLVRRWLDGADPGDPPYGTGPDTLLVAYYSSAEWGCHLALRWPMPERVLDLFAEFACLTSGMPPPNGRDLLGALTYHGLPGIDAVVKKEMQALAMLGGPYTAAECTALTDYCQTDVDALARLLPAMLPAIDVPRGLLRGRYTVAAARMEWAGTPLDVAALDRLRAGWDAVKNQLVQAVDADYGVFVPTNPRDPDGPWSFSAARWAEYLARNNVPWPRLESGALALDDDTFKEMSKLFPGRVGPVRDLRHALSQLKLNELADGPDCRNRCLLSMFASKTGRNQPSPSKFIFGPSCWLRSLIRPGAGRAVAYVDWSAQELGIAAALSGDPRMREAYASGDPYIWFGRSAGLVPPGATKETHGSDRDRLKVVMLGVLYGLSAGGMARKLGLTPAHGRDLMRMHRETFRRFWAWSDAIQDQAMLTGELWTMFGWRVRLGPDTTAPSLRNYPMQANGAEMMRLAACLATERGVGVCCPVHDAFLVEAAADAIDDEAGRMRQAMTEASELVLADFALRTDRKVVQFPDRYSDPRGAAMWETVTNLLDGLGPAPGPAPE